MGPNLLYGRYVDSTTVCVKDFYIEFQSRPRGVGASLIKQQKQRTQSPYLMFRLVNN